MSVSSEQIIKELKNRLKARLGERLHFIVLYGSVAKGEAGEDSDKEYVESCLRRADESLQAVKVLLQNNFLRDAVSRSYYAMFYATQVLLLPKMLRCQRDILVQLVCLESGSLKPVK